MTDIKVDFEPGATTPPVNATEVTKSDTEDLPFATRAIYVGVQGDVRVQTANGQITTYRDLVGTKVLSVVRVFATGTTAENIIAEW